MTRLPAAERREQLLRTAVALFAERGFSGTTTATLAKAAGVTEPIIYRHFPSKKDLFISVIERAGEATIELWERELESAKDPAQRLRRLIGANPMTWQGGRGMYRVIVQGLTEIDDPEIQAALREHVEKLHGFVAAEVERAQANDQVSRAFSPEITAWLLMHLGIGYGMLEALGMPRHAVDEGGVRVRQVVSKMMLGDRAKRVQDEMMRRRLGGDSGADGADG
jgi:AcrR family transcriptional regulator